MAKILQRLHGDYNVHVGQIVEPNTVIGTANGHGPGQTMASHDHISIGNGTTPNHSGWYNGCNNTLNPADYLIGIDNNNANAHFVFNQSMGWGGYGYLQQTPYTWYTDCRDNSLHDGIDYYAPYGSRLYAGVYGKVVDVGRQSNGLTYCYIEITDKQKRSNKPMENAKIDFSKNGVNVKFTGPVWTFDKDGNKTGETPNNWWARIINLNNGWYIAIWSHGDTFYLKSDDVNGDWVWAV